MRLKLLTLIMGLLLPFLAIVPARANHIIGSEISYKHIGHDSFMVIVAVYGDCNGIPASSPTVKAICGSSTITIGTMPGLNEDVTPVRPGSCTRCSNAGCTSTSFGFKKYNYTGIVDLSNVSGCDVTFTSSTCCRNAGDPIYLEAKLNRCTSGNHSSPAFEFQPITLLCEDQCVSLFQSAKKASEEDSLVYSLAKSMSNVGTYNTYPSGDSYDAPVHYEGYPNVNSPWGTSCKGFHYNAATGELNFKPTTTEYSFMAIHIQQWRKDNSGTYQLIGEIMRDCGIFITTCASNTQPSVSGINGTSADSIDLCAGTNTHFFIRTYDSNDDTLRFSWNKSIADASLTSNGFPKPIITFSWTPKASDVRSRPYTFIASAADNAPLTSTNSKIFYLFVHDSFPQINFQIDSLGCAEYRLSAPTDTSLGIQYSWEIDGQAASSEQNFTHTFRKDGQHPVKLEVINKAGCVKTFYDTIIISLPPFDAGKDTAICKGSSAQLKATGGTSYSWYPSYALSADNVANPVAQPDSTMKYYVKSIVAGCERIDSVTVTVSDFKLKVTPTVYKCSADEVEIEASGPDAVSFQWSPPVSIYQTRQAKTKVFPFKTITYYVTATNKYGCTAKDSVTVFVNSSAANAGPDIAICPGDSVQLQGSGGDVYTWSAAPGLRDTAIANPYVKPSKTQEYTLTARDSAGCTVTTDKVTVSVYSFSPAVSAGGKICKGDKISLSASGGRVYEWWPSAGLSNTAIANPVAQPTVSTMYHVKISNNLTGCSATDSVFVEVDDDCVWPGDANKDDLANYLDMLDIGVGYGSTGTARTNQGTGWMPYSAADWGTKTVDSIDYKHLDADGNGSIEADDTTAIALNYQWVNTKPGSDGKASDPAIFFQFAQDTFYAGDTVRATLSLGTTSFPIVNVYGAALEYSYSSNPVVTGTHSFDFVCGFLCPDNTPLSIYRTSSNRAQATIVRTNHNGMNGYGKLADISFVLKDRTYNYPSGGLRLYLSPVAAKVIDNMGQAFSIRMLSDSAVALKRKTTGTGIGANERMQSSLRIYPNPAHTQVTIEAEKQQHGRIYLMNMVGQQLKAIDLADSKTVVGLTELSAGIYLLRIELSGQLYQQKLIIQK